MAWRLRFTKGELDGKTRALGADPVMVGRSSACEIALPRSARDVSRRHILLRVQDGGVELTCLSEHRTCVDGVRIGSNNRCTLPPGATVELGHTTAFVLEPADGTSTATVRGGLDGLSEADRPTGELTGATFVPDAATAAPDRPTVAPEAAEEAFDGPTPAPGGLATPPGDKTNKLDTVIVSLEDIRQLIEEHNRRRSRRTAGRLAAAATLFVCAAAAYHFAQPAPEKTLTWPCTAAGAYDITVVRPEKTPFPARPFHLTVPGDAHMEVREDEHGVTTVRTRLGARRDVRLWVEFSCTRDPACVRKNRATLFEEKKRALAASGSWNFQVDRPLMFLGADNGLPYLEAQYLRSVRTETETEQRFGHLLFAVCGDCTITLLREIPAVEQWRGGVILANEPILGVDAAFLEERWEGRADRRDEPVDAMLAEADGLLSSKTPMHWQEVEFLLQSVLIQSAGDETVREKARVRLRDLRVKEKHEFHRLRGVWEKCRRMGDRAGCRRVLDEALKVFASPDDRRNDFFRKGGWE